LDVSKAIDKSSGEQRVPGTLKFKGGSQLGVMNDDNWIPKDVYTSEAVTDEAKTWSGYGTSLKPANEPICVARKPLDGTVANNVLTHGCGAINLDGCRIEGAKATTRDCLVPEAGKQTKRPRTYIPVGTQGMK
jgi:hypothetical protein